MKRIIIIIMIFVLFSLFSVNAFSINNTIPSEINSYEINLSEYVNVNDYDLANITLENTTYSIGYSIIGSDNDPNSFINITNAYDYDDSSYAYKSSSINNPNSGTTYELFLGKTFPSNKFIETVKIKADQSNTQTSYSSHEYNRLKLQTYDGSSWTTHTLLSDCDFANGGTCSYDSEITLNANVRGLRVYYSMNFEFSGSGVVTQTARLYELEYTENLDNYTFSTNGNQSYIISATNTSSSITENGVVLVNPYQYVYFTNATGGQIYNFTINGTLYENYFNPKLFDFGYGTHNFLFEKLGFNSTLFSLTFNTTSNINVTYSLPASAINVNIYDRTTGNYITDSVTLQVIATTGATGITTSGNYSFINLEFISEQYKIIASSSNYATEEIVFDFDNLESKDVSMYMIPVNSTNAGIIRLIVIDENYRYVTGATCSLLEWIPAQSAFISVAQASSNTNGQCYLNIELEDKVYQFSVTDGTNTVITESERVYIDSDSRTILLSAATSATTSFNEDYNIIINEVITGNTTTISYYSENVEGNSHTATLNYYKVIGNYKTLLNTTSQTGVIVDFSVEYPINLSYNVMVEATNTETNIVTQVKTFIYKGSSDISTELNKYGLVKFVIMAMLLFAVGIALSVMVEVGLVILTITIFISAFLFPQFITIKLAVSLTMITGLILWGVYKRK